MWVCCVKKSQWPFEVWRRLCISTLLLEDAFFVLKTLRHIVFKGWLFVPHDVWCGVVQGVIVVSNDCGRMIDCRVLKERKRFFWREMALKKEKKSILESRSLDLQAKKVKNSHTLTHTHTTHRHTRWSSQKSHTLAALTHNYSVVARDDGSNVSQQLLLGDRYRDVLALATVKQKLKLGRKLSNYSGPHSTILSVEIWVLLPWCQRLPSEVPTRHIENWIWAVAVPPTRELRTSKTVM